MWSQSVHEKPLGVGKQKNEFFDFLMGGPRMENGSNQDNRGIAAVE